MGKRGALLLMALGFISQARALDRIQIVAPSKFVLGEGAFSIRVKPLNGDAIDSTPCPIRFLNLPQGVTVASKTLPKEDVLKGETEFEVHVASSVKTGPLGLIVQTSSAPVVLGSAVVVVEGSPARLVVSPLPTEVGSSSRFLRVVVLDNRGLVVSSFHQDVDLKVSVGTLENALLKGTLFDNGVATTELRFVGGKPPSAPVRVTAVLKRLYPGQTSKTKGEALLSGGLR